MSARVHQLVVDAGLRAWARGLYPCEAAVELLIRTGFADPAYPWVFECGGCWSTTCDGGGMWGIDFGAIPRNVGVRSGSERRLLLIAAAIGGNVDVNLGDAVSGLDRTNMSLVLAALAHANGSHEHRVMGTISTPHGPMPWPTDDLAGTLFGWPA